MTAKTDPARPPETHNGQVPPSLDDQLAWLASLGSRANLRPLAEALLRDKFALQQALTEVRQHQEELRIRLEALAAPEHYPATITAEPADGEDTVEVFGAGMLLRVAVHPEVPRERLCVGACGLLSRGRNCLVHVDGYHPRWQDVGAFEGYDHAHERLLLRHHEQLVTAFPTPALARLELRKGDLIGFDRAGPGLAYARLEPPGREDLFFEQTPSDRFDELGGLDAQIAQLRRAVCFRLAQPELAARYRLPAKRGILLEGPPGNGKTKLARCLARFVAEQTPAGECRFMAIAGSSDYSMWLGQSEQRLIARFEAARELALRGGVPVVLFFDEIDAIGRRRGTDIGSSAPDRILGTFLAQLDGVLPIANLLVIGATNRPDILDQGLIRPGRLGDLKLRIPPPNRVGARAILRHYLGNDLPVAEDREAVIEGLLSQIYSPRGDYAELARVVLRDGRRVPVGAADLVSGALLENVVRLSAEEAADREAQTGRAGITEADLLAGLDRELRGAAALLAAHNVRGYVARLPQDVEPVAVELLSRTPGSALFVRSA
jgi:proteasome-associated ATPase